jgi:hypothetical protein
MGMMKSKYNFKDGNPSCKLVGYIGSAVFFSCGVGFINIGAI